MISEYDIKHVLLKVTDDYLGRLEIANGQVFLHLHVEKWNKTVFKALKQDFNLLLDELRNQGIGLLFIYGREKQIKMAKNMGRPFYSFTPLDPDYPGYFVASWET